MTLLTKQQILNASDMKTEDVEVPEWGGTVRVRTLTGAQRDTFEASLSRTEKGKRVPNFVNMRAKLVAVCVVDEQGARVFDDNEVVMLGRKSAAGLDRVFSVCQRLNGITKEDVEELEKNLEAAPSGDSILNSASH